MPIDGLPSTHLFKRAGERFPDMVLNEAFCLAIGRHLGISTVHAEVMRIPEPILVVERYDRQIDANGRVGRVHQEDMAQALGTPVSAKYEQHGGPSLRAIAKLLREAGEGQDDLLRLLDTTLLNVLVGNADAHAKNLSLLHVKPGVCRLAPAYDVVSTAFYPQVDLQLGMFINGKTSVQAVTRQDVIDEASSWRLPPDMVQHRIAQLLAGVAAAVEAALITVPDVPPGLVTLVQERYQRLMAGVAGST